MHLRRRTPLFAALTLVCVLGLRAQIGADPSGHWEGKMKVPGKEIAVEVDIAKNIKGEFGGTISMPAEHAKGLPLAKVAVEGRSISFFAREDQPMDGVLSDDGKSISGTVAIGGHSIPMNMTRTGDPRIEPPARIAAIGKDLEGTWNATMDAGGKPLQLVLTMMNQSDGTATASIVNVDEGKLRIPVSAITRAATKVTFDFASIDGSYAATLSDDGMELVGTFREGPVALPLTFRRAAGDSKK